MSKLIIYLLISSASANWYPAWLKETPPEWVHATPLQNEPIGISVYCGSGTFATRTRILISLQNRSDQDYCMIASDLVQLSQKEIKNVQENAPIKGRHLSVKNKSGLTSLAKRKTIANLVTQCRKLSSDKQALENFEFSTNSRKCDDEVLTLHPGDIFEGSYDFQVPYMDLEEFEIAIPKTCDAKKRLMLKYTLRCQASIQK